MKYCRKLNQPIINIDEEDCPDDCRKCDKCIEVDIEQVGKKEVKAVWLP